MTLRRSFVHTISYNFAALTALAACACGGGSDEPTSGAGAAGGAGGSLAGGTGGISGGGAGGSLSGGAGGTSGVTTGGAGGVITTGGAGGVSSGGAAGFGTGGTAGIGTGGGAGVGGTAGTSGESACLDGITNYTTAGPFTYTTARSGQVNLWIPNVPAGCKVPITHLANGTGASCASYAAILQRLASHGFLTTCYENTNTGQGTQCLTAVQTALDNYPELAAKKVGSTGHSQGGGGAIMCVYRVEQQFGTEIQIVGHAMEPASGFGDSPANWASLYGQIRSPIFLFNGSVDTLVSASWVRQAFDALGDGIEAYWYQADGASHIPIPTSWTQESTVAWFRWKLLGDRQACEYFKAMPNGTSWTLQGSQNDTGC